MTRYALLLVALTTGIYAVAMWICGMLTDAGVAAATSAAAVLMAEFAAYCQRRRWRAGREQVWARREQYNIEDLFAEQARTWEQRHTTTFMTYDKDGEPAAGFNSQGLGGVWDFDNGAPE